MPEHNDLAGLSLHGPFHYEQPTDPGAVGAGKWWADTSSGIIYRRDALDADWEIWGGGGGGGGGGTYVAVPPTAETTAGTKGEYSVDSSWLYLCTATNFWKRVQLATFPLTIVLAYVSDGDLNGVFTFIGKGKLVGGVWSNPSTLGYITIVPNPAMGLGVVANLVDHVANDAWISPGANSTYTIDLGSNQQLICDKWSFRQRSTGSVSGTADCTLLGSNDGSTFTVVDTRTSAEIPQTSNTWGSFTVASAVAYRYWRLRQTANSHFTIGEVELYGTLYYIP
jgi:hypothetical protein